MSRLRPHFKEHRAHVDHLVQAALAAADPELLVADRLRSASLPELAGDGHLYLVAIGKAAATMARAAHAVLGERIHLAALVGKSPHPPAWLPAGWQYHAGSHPVPDARSVDAATAVATMLQATQPEDQLLVLLSGGASALFSHPRLALADWQSLTAALLASGCPIDHFNIVRRHLDAVKGGGLARLAAPARCHALILSDVVGSALAAIGSGPTVPLAEPVENALAILDHYAVANRLTPSVWARVQDTLRQERDKRGDNYPRPTNEIIGDNHRAGQAAAQAAAALGFDPIHLTSHLQGEAREVGKVVAALAQDAPDGACYVLGGETTVTLRGKGAGGRNQELALATAVALQNVPRRIVFTLATDGEDGPTAAAGAIVSGRTVKQAEAAGLDAAGALAANDSFTFFTHLDAGRQHIVTGPTGTNVNDLTFILAYSP